MTKLFFAFLKHRGKIAGLGQASMLEPKIHRKGQIGIWGVWADPGS